MQLWMLSLSGGRFFWDQDCDKISDLGKALGLYGHESASWPWVKRAKWEGKAIPFGPLLL